MVTVGELLQGGASVLNKEDAEKSAEELKNYAKDVHICTPVSKGCKIESE